MAKYITKVTADTAKNTLEFCGHTLTEVWTEQGTFCGKTIHKMAEQIFPDLPPDILDAIDNLDCYGDELDRISFIKILDDYEKSVIPENPIA